MSILNLKKKTPVKKETSKSKKVAVLPAVPAVKTSAFSGVFDPRIIVKPRVTEKATMLSEGGRTVAVFEVSDRANKKNVAVAIQALYKVKPVKVAILRVPPKKSFIKGHIAYGKTRRKAYVYLKEGDKIES